MIRPRPSRSRRRLRKREPARRRRATAGTVCGSGRRKGCGCVCRPAAVDRRGTAQRRRLDRRRGGRPARRDRGRRAGGDGARGARAAGPTSRPPQPGLIAASTRTCPAPPRPPPSPRWCDSRRWSSRRARAPNGTSDRGRRRRGGRRGRRLDCGRRHGRLRGDAPLRGGTRRGRGAIQRLESARHWLGPRVRRRLRRKAAARRAEFLRFSGSGPAVGAPRGRGARSCAGRPGRRRPETGRSRERHRRSSE